jgi:carboxymethylenebutenolidase
MIEIPTRDGVADAYFAHPEDGVRHPGVLFYMDAFGVRPHLKAMADRTGYCMGARLSLRTAGAYPERVAAAAGFHGGGLATDAPDSPHLVADRVAAELYFGHADRDHSLPPEQIERLNAALTEARVRFQAEVYEGARHGYTQADTSSYNADAAERHWNELLALFERTLPQV